MSLMPRTLAGRVFLVIIAGLVVAHLASYVLFEVERARSLEKFSAAEVAARIVDATRRPTPVRHRIFRGSRLMAISTSAT